MPVVTKLKASVALSRPEDAATARLLAQIEQAQIEQWPVAGVRPNPRSAKKHSRKQIELLAQNISKYGFHQPIVVDEDGNILIGHARYAAAGELRLPLVPVIVLRGLTPQQKVAVALSDNKLVELGSWDQEDLAFNVQMLCDPKIGTLYDIRDLGFETPEIDLMMMGGQTQPARRLKAEVVALPSTDAVPVTKPGDTWICGEHRLHCGDARESSAYDLLMAGERARMVFADHPYNVPNTGHATRRPNVKNFAVAGGEMSEGEFSEFLTTSCALIRRHTAEGAAVFLCMDWRHMEILQRAGEAAFGKLRNLIVWDKMNFGMGHGYRSQHELIFLYVLGSGNPINKFMAGKKGRYRSNVWSYAGMNSFSRDRSELLAVHPTVKPAAMIMDAILDCTDRGDIVLDPFAGSGTTMIAAEKTKRVARLMEIDPLYCDCIVRRWQELTKQEAKLAASGTSFGDVERNCLATGETIHV
jgi:DNA modification methylase